MLITKINFCSRNNQKGNNRQIYKGVILRIFGENMTEIAVWWNGLGKELENDLESQEELKDNRSL